jgi:hypothetical protein
MAQIQPWPGEVPIEVKVFPAYPKKNKDKKSLSIPKQLDFGAVKNVKNGCYEQ